MNYASRFNRLLLLLTTQISHICLKYDKKNIDFLHYVLFGFGQKTNFVKP